ncbi:ubiquitin-like protein ISG15 [Pseudoliparis swirei]|uniref:ubiquitin-like protein ISG15 n=1 Tax=Pseudoliparis swirei TaxID=2059687 RepID=UPI0024BE121D|nr:ubiquitin-like protein ISG15 [Pseudoliparis swirei]
MEITIKMLDGLSHRLCVDPRDTVGSVKLMIQQQLGVPSERQKLVVLDDADTQLSDDSRAIGHCGLQPGATVSLLVTEPVAQPVQVFFKNEKGQTSTYDITPDETVGHFMSRVQSREGVPVSQQRLTHQSREMQADQKLSHYGVKALSTIELKLRLRGG